jgi:hypothetical protein
VTTSSCSGNGGAFATAKAGPTGASLASGRIGVNARLINAAGDVINQSGWVYNTSSSVSAGNFFQTTSGTQCNTVPHLIQFRSYSVTRGYTPSAGTTNSFYTFYTGTLQP